MRWLALSLFFSVLAAPLWAAPPPHVTASIKPVHALLSKVMEGVGTPFLLVDGQVSPHHFSLRPSQLRALRESEAVFYIDEAYERFLARILKKLPPKQPRIALSRLDGIRRLAARSGTGQDWHFWLDPANAIVMAEEMASRLSELFPRHQETFLANAAKLKKEILALDKTLEAQLRPLAGKRFAVYHDAYQYLEHRYGLAAPDVIAAGPEHQIRPAHLQALRKEIRKGRIACVFTEPGVDPDILRRLTEHTKAQSPLLDPEAVLAPPGAYLYVHMMRQIGERMADCLK